jgi:hypothetical protein
MTEYLLLVSAVALAFLVPLPVTGRTLPEEMLYALSRFYAEIVSLLCLPIP